MRVLRLRPSAAPWGAAGQGLVFLLPLAVAALILPSSIALATTRTVISLADSGAGTLRDAVMASDNGDTIDFSVTGVISLTSGQLLITKSMTITGPGENLLEVTRGSGNDFRIFELDSGNVSISGLALTNGFAFGGLSASQGGCIALFGANLTLSDCIINGNTAQFDGGAIAVVSGSLTVSNCTFSGNGTSDPSNGDGGAIFTEISGAVTVTNSTFSGNTCATQGGAILNYYGTLTVRNSTFSGNSAGTLGGGIANHDGTVALTNCTLSGNSASTGGGIYSEGFGDGNTANVTVSSCTISGNSASIGGGIYNTGTNAGNAFVSLENTILQTGAAGANLVNVGLGTSITSQGFNLSSDNGGGFLTAGGDRINTNPQLGSLQDNGGPTLTMALLPGSPALDQGKNFGVSTDQRGLPRPTNLPTIPNASGGDGSDIGAVEVQAVPPFVVTTTADHDDGTCSPDDCTLREAINLANAAAGADTITFASGVTGTIILGPGLGTLTVTDSVTISGPGSRLLAVSGNSALRVFYFSSGSNAVSGLTIRDGAATGAAGSGSVAGGGGIFNAINSSLSLTNCSVNGNHVQGADNATAASVGGDGRGGAIGNSGILTLNGCTFSGNSAVGGRGGDGSSSMGGNVHSGAGGAGLGGAIFNDTSATLTITDSTFGSNSATGGAGGNGQFGGTGGSATAGIFNLGTMTVTAATLAGNVGLGGAGGKGNNIINNGGGGAGRGGLTAGGGTSLIRDTISAGNTGNRSGGPDVDGTFTSGGYNLIGIGDPSTGFAGTGDQVGTTAAPLNANLGLLQDNGGPTETIALLCGSPAIDKGSSDGLTTDQRGPGFARTVDDSVMPNAPGGDGTDIGAFELQQSCSPPSPTATPTRTSTNSPTWTTTVTPTSTPTNSPTQTPTATPTRAPTDSPTRTPSATPIATHTPSLKPTVTPTSTPSKTPTSTTTTTGTQTPTLTVRAPATPTATPRPSPQSTATASPTLTPTTVIACAGDCDGNIQVTVDEILTLVNVALGSADVSQCRAGDVNRDGDITIDEILSAINNALNGCGDH